MDLKDLKKFELVGDEQYVLLADVEKLVGTLQSKIHAHKLEMKFTATLEGKPLDWALADALEYAPQIQIGYVFVPALKKGWPIDGVVPFSHTDPETCLGLTKKINIMQQANDGSWRVAAFCEKGKRYKTHGKTLEEAIARCVVAMRLGNQVEVPDQLCGLPPLTVSKTIEANQEQ